MARTWRPTSNKYARQRRTPVTHSRRLSITLLGSGGAQLRGSVPGGRRRCFGPRRPVPKTGRGALPGATRIHRKGEDGCLVSKQGPQRRLVARGAGEEASGYPEGDDGQSQCMGCCRKEEGRTLTLPTDSCKIDSGHDASVAGRAKGTCRNKCGNGWRGVAAALRRTERKTSRG